MSLNHRFLEHPSKPALGKLPKPDKKSWKSTEAVALLNPRPIATNSRVKQGEKYRKDMYLAYLNNALQQKANVRIST